MIQLRTNKYNILFSFNHYRCYFLMYLVEHNGDQTTDTKRFNESSYQVRLLKNQFNVCFACTNFRKILRTQKPTSICVLQWGHCLQLPLSQSWLKLSSMALSKVFFPYRDSISFLPASSAAKYSARTASKFSEHVTKKEKKHKLRSSLVNRVASALYMLKSQ